MKAQHYTWFDFTGIPGPAPTDWLKETQMGIAEITAHEGRQMRWATKGMGIYGQQS